MLDPQTVQTIVEVVPACVTGLAGICTSIALAVRGGKWKNLFKKVPAVHEHTKKLVDLIKEAETHTAYSGKDKLRYVATAYNQYCIENKLVFDEQSVIENIEELVALTKEVNTHSSQNHRL